jgi:hypothetical protein
MFPAGLASGTPAVSGEAPPPPEMADTPTIGLGETAWGAAPQETTVSARPKTIHLDIGALHVLGASLAARGSRSIPASIG